MKKYIVPTTTLLLLFITNSSSFGQQYISLGPIIGFGHSGTSSGKMSDHAEIKSQFNPSFSAGLGIIYAKHEHWGFGGEILYAKEGYKKEFNFSDVNLNYDETNTANYIRIPLKAYYFFNGYQSKIRPKIYAGPSFAFKIGDDFKREGNDEISKKVINDLESFYEYKTFDLGIQLGVGLNINLSRSMWLNLDLNYTQGLLDALDESSSLIEDSGYNMNQKLQFQAGLLFGLGK